MQNRLKAVRKAKRKTQQEIAALIGINQNTYSYWENGKVNIDNESLRKLSEIFGVSIDFLIGRPYEATKPVHQWHVSLQEDYARADQCEKELMLYKYGGLKYVDSADAARSCDVDDELVQKIGRLDEIDRIKADAFITGLLAAEKYSADVAADPVYRIAIAARGGGVKEEIVTRRELDALEKLPDLKAPGKS